MVVIIVLAEGHMEGEGDQNAGLLESVPKGAQTNWPTRAATSTGRTRRVYHRTGK